jgi:hypothetical protein
MAGRGGRPTPVVVAAFILVYAALYLYYVFPSINSPDPVFLGLSRALAYALLLWLAMMAVVVAAYLYVWR